MTRLDGKRILLGVTGSIAAYKAADICSQLSKLDADIHVVLTDHAAKFVGAPTFRALTRNSVITDLFDEPAERRIAHIDLAQSADLILVAPATANVIARLAHGIADDMLSTCLLAAPRTTPVLVAPAMNTVMWEHPATLVNLATLKRYGVEIVEPGFGVLACQDVGTGKLADVAEIVQAVIRRLTRSQEFAGVDFLVTAGATREPLDPVRFLTNRSSGRMGYAIAEEARARGANVTLVSGWASIDPPEGVHLVRVETAAEMLAACRERMNGYSVFVAAAAVADYTPETVSDRKIKKTTSRELEEPMSIRLKRTEDILATLGAAKRTGQIVVGFAAETEDLLVNARRKLQEKRADLIVANDVLTEGAGFDVETNVVTILGKEGDQSLPLLTKREVAARLLDRIANLRAAGGAALETKP